MIDRTKLDRVLLASASKEDATDKTLLHHSMNDWTNSKINTYFVLNNKDPLHKVYNNAIKWAIDGDYDALILVHDDVIMEHDPIPKLEKLFTKYGLVGVAGCSKAEVKSPAFWHLMGGGFNSGNLHGAVSHGNYFNKMMTSFGAYPNRVLMIDGVFMAMTRDVFMNNKFDESNPANFHFYDLDFSLSCHKNGVCVGVGDIFITHASPGLRSLTHEWQSGEKWFLDKHEPK